MALKFNGTEAEIRAALSAMITDPGTVAAMLTSALKDRISTMWEFDDERYNAKVQRVNSLGLVMESYGSFNLIVAGVPEGITDVVIKFDRFDKNSPAMELVVVHRYTIDYHAFNANMTAAIRALNS